jgi:hypothetical protein
MGRDLLDVWATGDGVRVSPETGKYLEDRTDIHEDYPSGDYHKRNAVWDAATRSVRLRAARNEFVSFQVIVGSAKPVGGLTVRFDSLIGPGGVQLSGRNLALFKAWYVRVEKPSHGYQKTSLGPGWYPDALLPAAKDGGVSFNIPSKINHIGASQKNQTVWVDIFIPRNRKDAPPGDYTGQIVVSGDGKALAVKIRLKVWDFALPDEIHCQGDIWNGSLRRMTADQEMKYYQMLHRHRIQPGVAGYRPEVKIAETKVELDWAEYDRRLARYFDGSAFTGKHGYWGPGYGTPIPHIQLPFNCNKPNRKGGWPVTMEGNRLTREGEAIWLETCRQFKEHFDANPTWSKVRRVVFLGGMDETYQQWAYEKMIYFCKLLRRGLGKDWFDYRIDGGYNSPAMRQLYKYVDLWVCHTAGWNREKIVNFQGKGVELWFYGPMVYERQANSGCGSNTLTDIDLLSCQGVGWAAWKCRSGYCQWEFDAWHDSQRTRKRPTAPFDRAWTNPVNCRIGTREYNGSGLLIYRGELAGLKGPVPSIRLKSHRRGFQDHEYFWLLRHAGKGAEADRLVNSIIPTYPFGPKNYTNTDIWKHNPEQWDAVRIKAGEMLAGLSSR